MPHLSGPPNFRPPHEGHEGIEPGGPGGKFIPPNNGGTTDPPNNGGTTPGPIGSGDPGNPDALFPPSADAILNGFTPSESIFGWSWLGEWAEEAPYTHPDQALAAAWLQGWVEKFNQAAEEELSGAVTGTRTDVVVQNFLVDLAKQSWWEDRTALWQSVQKLKYGTAVPRGEYDALVQSYRDYVGDAARRLGLVDTNGNLTFDINGAEITELIEGVDGLMLNAGSVVNDLPTPDPIAADRLLEKHFLSPRTFDTDEGTPTFGPGALQDTYNWIKSLATDNYITLGDEEIWDMVFRLKREEISTQGVWDRIAGQVGDQYDFLDGTGIMNRINQFTANTDGSNWMGASNIKSHLTPVRTAVANTWGLGENEINLSDVFGSGLEDLTISNEDGSQRFMNSREAKQWARQQPQYKETTAYKTGMSNIAHTMLQGLGVR